MRPSGPALPAYLKSAAFYDAIYAGKEYAKEAREIERLVRRFGRPGSRTLLDVACGTGNHLVHLRRRFEVIGVDPNPEMLRVARRKLPGVRFLRGPMQTLDLGRSFDVVTCMFSAIGYVRSERELRRTIARFAAHLRPGGVAIVEPWFHPDRYRPGGFHAELRGSSVRPIARMNLSLRRRDRSILDMHHLVATERGVRHWVERHDLGLFPPRAYRAAFRAAGLRPQRLPGWNPARGIYVGVKPEGRGPAPGSSTRRLRGSHPSPAAARMPKRAAAARVARPPVDRRDLRCVLDRVERDARRAAPIRARPS
jgi:ubiquinone/menaquinone biosynthesis C-methylase UbiE